MKVCFILTKCSRKPIGGYKIVFEYANRLCEKGYDVSILFLNETLLYNTKISDNLRKILAMVLTNLEPRWFKLDSRIKKISNLNKNCKYKLQDMDVSVATAVRTVDPSLEIMPNAKHLYLIQGFENWDVDDATVIKTYNKGMINIVVSKWLKEFVDEHSNTKSILIRNPIDLTIYHVITPIEKRKSHSIALLYHLDECKGFKYSFEALRCLKEIYPDLSVKMFGTAISPSNLPTWFEYTRNASQQKTIEIYNSVTVFMCSSIEEGFGLTGMEAMACGAALASSAYKGVLEYAENEKTALLSRIRDVDGMVKNVCELFENVEKRYKLIVRGVNNLKQFTWEQASEEFEKILLYEEI